VFWNGGPSVGGRGGIEREELKQDINMSCDLLRPKKQLEVIQAHPQEIT
jgi:hypothetical protein